MQKTEVITNAVRAYHGAFSQGIVANGRMLFVSGITADRADGSIAGIGDVAEQTKQVISNIKAIVEAAGGTLDDVCRVDIYVRNMEHLKTIHEVRRQHFNPPLPASTMVEVAKMVSPDYLVEISAIAVLSDRAKS